MINKSSDLNLCIYVIKSGAHIGDVSLTEVEKSGHAEDKSRSSSR